MNHYFKLNLFNELVNLVHKNVLTDSLSDSLIGSQLLKSSLDMKIIIHALGAKISRKMGEEPFNVNKIPIYTFHFTSQNVYSMFVISRL